MGVWHRRLGYDSRESVTAIQNASEGVKIVTERGYSKCVVCTKGKQTQTSHGNQPLEQSDVMGLLKVPSFSSA